MQKRVSKIVSPRACHKVPDSMLGPCTAVAQVRWVYPGCPGGCMGQGYGHRVMGAWVHGSRRFFRIAYNNAWEQYNNSTPSTICNAIL